MEYKSSPKRPYLLRAYYDWLVDNDFTPYLVVDANYCGVNVPMEYVKDGQIVLNLSANATGNLELTNDFIRFNARFRGVPRDIYIPIGAAVAIYARENGDGVMFEYEAVYEELNKPICEEQPTSPQQAVDTPKTKSTTKSAVKSAPHLRIVK